MEFNLVALCLFGLEHTLKYELTRIGAGKIAAEDGRVFFSGDERVLARANLTLSVAERVSIVLGRFHADTFEALFSGVAESPLEQYIGKNDAFPVKGACLSSKLSSVPACQAIVKKAAAKRLGGFYQTEWMPETGVVHGLSFTLLRDDCLFLLDTSGPSLYKRGYRMDANSAPIRETLASGIADLAGVRANSVVYDPMCGSGTLLIEAGFRAKGLAVGAKRAFACEEYAFLPKALFAEEREKAQQMGRPSSFCACGSDIDPEAVALAKKNIARAGLSDCIQVHTRPAAAFRPEKGAGVLLCNPPYGDRMLTPQACQLLYKEMGETLGRFPELSAAIITQAAEFETDFGRRADKKRKLYNGMKPCTLYLYTSKNS